MLPNNSASEHDTPSTEPLAYLDKENRYRVENLALSCLDRMKRMFEGLTEEDVMSLPGDDDNESPETIAAENQKMGDHVPIE
ncbi:hypothetical protein BGW38_005553, partial [Lunasporangiospora selenospora]